MRMFNFLSIAVDTMIMPGMLFYFKHQAKYLKEKEETE